MWFGYAVLFIVATLAGIIAIGHVEQKTSYGLEYLLGALTTLAGAFGHWAFGEAKDATQKGATQNGNSGNTTTGSASVNTSSIGTSAT